MNKILLLLISLTFSLVAAQNESFSQSKKDLERIYADHSITFYCGCKYDKLKKGNMIDRSSCGYVPRNPITKSGKVNPHKMKLSPQELNKFSAWNKEDPVDAWEIEKSKRIKVIQGNGNP